MLQVHWYYETATLNESEASTITCLVVRVIRNYASEATHFIIADFSSWMIEFTSEAIRMSKTNYYSEAITFLKVLLKLFTMVSPSFLKAITAKQIITKSIVISSLL
jgi:valyl-tRNA synthetase